MKNSTYHSLTKKDIWMYSIASLVILFGWIITFMGLFLPPPGEVHSSVLLILGQSLLFGAAIFGVTYYVKSVIGEFRTSTTNKILNKLEKIYPEETDNSEETIIEEDL